MASQWRDSREERLARSNNRLFRIPPHVYRDSPERERCELILWIEADWHCEYWMRGESGAMRLLNGPDTIS